MADTFGDHPQWTQTLTDLASLVFTKTRGHPFFVKEMLKSLHERRLLVFDVHQRCWQWNPDHIEGLGLVDDATAFMAAKIQQLPDETQRLLQYAACLGHQFDLPTLSIALDLSRSAVTDAIRESVRHGLVVPGLEHGTYGFLHDCVQQAASSLIPEDRRPEAHLQIGRRLLRRLGDAERPTRLFEIVDHLNAGRGLLTDAEEREELARLNLMAGKQAKASTAYESAFGYVRTGLALLPEERWESRYALAFDLSIECAECAYLSGRFDEAERLFAELRRQARSVLDHAAVARIQIVLLLNQGKHQQALAVLKDALVLCRMPLPEHQADYHRRVQATLQEVRGLLGGRPVGILQSLPEMTDPHQQAVIGLLVAASPAAYFTDLNLFHMLNLFIMKTSMQYGNMAASSWGYVGVGILLGSRLGEYEAGYEMGKLAIAVSERFGDRVFIGKTHFMMAHFLNHWKQHLSANFAHLERSEQLCLETGDFVVAGFCGCTMVYTTICKGDPLKTVYETAQRALEFTRRVKHDVMTHDLILAQRMALALEGATSDPRSFNGEGYDEVAHVEQLSAIERKVPLTMYYLFKAQLLYLFGCEAQAMAMAEKAEQVRGASLGFIFTHEQAFWHALTLAAHLTPSPSPLPHDEGEARVREGCRHALAKHQAQLKAWAESCPENFLHKHLLVSAEVARLSGEDHEAQRLYDQAIRSARDSGFVQHQALANELAARLCLAKGQEAVARLYLVEARDGYQRWGATAKVRDLDARYPSLVTTFSPALTTTFPSLVLDWMAVLKALQAISREVELPVLLNTLITLIIEQAGAQRGWLVMEQDGRLMIEAEGAIDTETLVLQSIPADTAALLPISLIRYVARTKEPVVIDEMAQEKRFAKDPYFADHPPKSVLCVPLLNRKALSGVLYLENHLAAGTFTPRRVEIVQLLSVQAAISIENARLFVGLQEWRQRSYRDGLTGVLNRRGFIEQLDAELARAIRYQHPFALLMLDLDHFKSINDTYGHLCGDRVLVEVAELLQATVRKTDQVARYGGEEFCCLLPKVDPVAAAGVADKICRLVAARELAGLRVTTSVGVAGYPTDAETATALVEQADLALYRAKQTGRNRVISADQLRSGNC